MIRTLTRIGAALIAVAAVASLAGAQSATYCQCKVANQQITTNSSVGVCKDLTQVIHKSYTITPFTNMQSVTNDCAAICKSYLQNQSSQALASACCQIHSPNGAHIQAYAYVVLPQVSTINYYGTLTNTQGTVVQTCPSGWLADSSGQPGVTLNGKCRRAAGTVTTSWLPPNGTPVGTYGVVLGNTLYAWGTTANGGAAVTTTSGGPVCHL